jgi:hypothetical protein
LNDGGAGGTAGAGGAQASFTLSQTLLSFSALCVFTPQTVIITNTSSVPLTWHASGDVSAVLLTPNGSTLQPGDGVSVSVLPQIQASAFLGSPLVVSIDADVAPSQSIEVDALLIGKPAPPQPLPPDVDFGNVRVGDAVTGFVGVVGGSVQVLTSSNSWVFALSGAAPNLQSGFGFGWTVTFQPATAGPQQSTLTFTDFAMDICPPNTITARGVGVDP